MAEQTQGDSGPTIFDQVTTVEAIIEATSANVEIRVNTRAILDSIVLGPLPNASLIDPFENVLLASNLQDSHLTSSA